jgi:hypothetical protein
MVQPPHGVKGYRGVHLQRGDLSIASLLTPHGRHKLPGSRAAAAAAATSRAMCPLVCLLFRNIHFISVVPAGVREEQRPVRGSSEAGEKQGAESFW